jgi:acyl-CoA thioesterase-1
MPRRFQPLRAALVSFPSAVLLALSCALSPALAGCGGSEAGPLERQGAAPTSAERERSGLPLVVFLGDSLTAGLGLAKDRAYPALLRDSLEAEGRGFRLLNSGVSGDTSAGGLARLDWILRQDPDVLVVGLGANDGLRGLPVEQMEANLRVIVERGREAGARVLLLGMRLPPNYGPDYVEEFEAAYPRLARELEVPFVPFLLEGVAGDPRLNQDDGIHPNAAGQERVASNVAGPLRELLEELAAPGEGDAP